MASSSTFSMTNSSNNVPQLRLKLCYLSRVKLFLISPQLLSFSKIHNLCIQAFPEISSSSVELSYRDGEGDAVIVDDDDSLTIALSSLQDAEPSSAELKFHIQKLFSSFHDETSDKARKQGSAVQICHHYKSSGSCRFGSSCKFQHQDSSTSVKFGSSSSDNGLSLSSNGNLAGISANNSSNLLSPRGFCRQFRAGTCRFGTKCKFSHHISSNSYSNLNAARRDNESLSETEIERWLLALERTSGPDNISFLSSNEGFDSMIQIINHSQLSEKAIAKLVGILTRLEFRTSILRQTTDKIYSALLGSQFLNSLHSHIRCNVRAVPNSIEPYLLLCEEVVNRCDSGWKEAPLDELKTLVDEAEGDWGKEMSYSLARLLEHRSKKKRIEAVSDHHSPADMDLRFRIQPIIPPMNQLLHSQDSCDLPVNKVGIRYSSIPAYLDTHFRLMQEDCFATLREGISQIRNNSKDASMHVYKNVKFIGIECGSECIVYRMSFNVKARKDWYENTKRLMHGSLLCISCDNFQTFLWGIVADRSKELLAKSLIDIKILELNEGKGIEPEKCYVMAESSAAYFEAYYHVLLNLQRPEMDNLPFAEHLISLEPRVKEPVYLKKRNQGDVYDFGTAFSAMKEQLTTTRLHILQDWPEWTSTLDQSQVTALKHGLTKRLALIQGPPGTGKTFVGLMIVKILLENLKNFRSYPEVFDELMPIKGPVLVICYTNHALDQFMKGIYSEEKCIIRIGGRSKCPELEPCNLQTLLKNKDFSNWDRELSAREVVSSALLDDRNRAYRHQKDLSNNIQQYAQLLRIDAVTKEMLHGVATEDQIQSLFYDEQYEGKKIVTMWLTASEKVVVSKERHQAQRMQDFASHNSFEVFKNQDYHEQGDESPLRIQHNKDRPSSSNNHLNISNSSMGNTNSDQVVQNHERSSNEGIEKDEASDWKCVKIKRNKPFKELISTTEEVETNEDTTEVLEPKLSLEVLINCADVWSLDVQGRRALHEYWLQSIKRIAQERIQELSTEYEALCKNLRDIEKEIQLTLMRKAKVVGMTTTRAARNHDILEALQAEIIVVEEAAEVLESHILACLTPFTKHLILIGDHLQLRPSVAVHELAIKKHLDVSMFERLAKGGVEYVTLNVQRRMRPSISKLISSIYPMLKDHPSTAELEDVKGVKSNVFFLNHSSHEEHLAGEESSKRNLEEAKLVVELCVYLVKQGYTNADITILSMYTGQAQEIFKRLSQKLPRNSRDQEGKHTESMPRISSVDDYQGEECKIIILSLVRSNSLPTKGGIGKIGFLKIANRVCVALSRAKNGLFIFGNGDLLYQKSELWKEVIDELRKSESYGNSLILTCQNHPGTETSITKPADFLNVPDGGCNQPCEHQLSCGHACPKRCHPGYHKNVVCPKKCPRTLESCSHQCQSLCHGFTECPSCQEPVIRKLPCGHLVTSACSTLIDSITCRVPCLKMLECSHKCQNICGTVCTSRCTEMVKRELPCGHIAIMQCYKNPSEYVCKQPCNKILPDCEHTCSGTCGTCKQGNEHIPCKAMCERILPCGHPCTAECHKTCPPCSMPCQKRCTHSRCPLQCGYPCVPCMEPCNRKCTHIKCTLLCHEMCEVPCCNEPCTKLLKQCKHLCMGLCGEPCPPICRICVRPKGFKDIFSQMTIDELEEDDRFIQLEDCRHIFEVTGLDVWMRTEQAGSGTKNILPKQCPECRVPIVRSKRYANHVKEKQQHIEEVKKKIIAADVTNQGIRFIQQRKFEDAVQQFIKAIEQTVANYETYYGLGLALCSLSMYEFGAEVMKFIVKNSKLGKAEASEINKVASKLVLKKSTMGGERGRLKLSSQAQHKLENIVQLDSKKTLKQGVWEAEDEVAMKAMNQWALALTNLSKFEAALDICRIMLKREPGNIGAREIMKKAQNGEKVVKDVVGAMMKEVGGRGHWYMCPNGHYYVVGECGGPMQESKCPDCGATVGGRNHAPAEGNAHSSIDGSTRAAYGDHVGLGNVAQFL